MQQRKKMRRIIVIPTSGLGNRMRAIAAGYALATEFHKPLDVVWHKEAGLNADFCDIFATEHLPFKVKTVASLKYLFLYDIPRKKNGFFPAFLRLFDSRKWLYHDRKTAERMEDEDFRRLADENRDLVIISCYPFYTFEEGILRQLFKPGKIVEERIAEITQGENPEIALHIRRTDNNLSIANSPLCLFESVLVNEISRDKEVKIFVATDDESTKSYMAQTYGKNIMYNPAAARRDTIQGMVDAVAELEIISKCRRIYGSYTSSYSEVASQLRGGEFIVLCKK